MVRHSLPCSLAAHPIQSHDTSASIAPGTVAASMSLRQWMELSLTGDQVTVELLPDAPPYLQSIDLVASFLKKNYENPTPFDLDEMISKLLNAYSGLVFAPGGILTMDFKGDKLRLVVASISIVDLADEQKFGMRNQSRSIEMGVMMQKTDITIMKDGGSPMKIKASAKR